MLHKKIAKLRDFVTALYIKSYCKINELKQDEDGMEVIQVVMLIAVGVLAIAAVWAGVNGLLEDWWDIITGSSSGQGGPNLGG